MVWTTDSCTVTTKTHDWVICGIENRTAVLWQPRHTTDSYLLYGKQTTVLWQSRHTTDSYLWYGKQNTQLTVTCGMENRQLYCDNQDWQLSVIRKTRQLCCNNQDTLLTVICGMKNRTQNWQLPVVWKTAVLWQPRLTVICNKEDMTAVLWQPRHTTDSYLWYGKQNTELTGTCGMENRQLYCDNQDWQLFAIRKTRQLYCDNQDAQLTVICDKEESAGPHLAHCSLAAERTRACPHCCYCW